MSSTGHRLSFVVNVHPLQIMLELCYLIADYPLAKHPLLFCVIEVPKYASFYMDNL